MEEIRKILETLKNQMDEAWDEYNTSLETSLASLKTALHNFPKPPAARFELEKAVSMISRVSQPAAAPTPPPAGGADLAGLRAAMRRIDGGKTQVEILDLYLDEASKYASRVALFIFKGEQAMGWKGMGYSRLGGDDSKIKSVVLPLSEGNPLHKVYQTKRSLLSEPLGEDVLGRGFDGPRPHRVFLVPMVIRDKVSAALYADEVKGAGDLNPDALELLTFTASLGINLLGQRQTLPCPSLTAPGPIKVEGARAAQPAAPPPEPAPSSLAAVAVTAPVSERTQKIDVSAMAELEALRRETMKKAHQTAEERPAPPPPPPPAMKPLPSQLEETKVSEPPARPVPVQVEIPAPAPEPPAPEPQYELEYAAEPEITPEPVPEPEPEPAVEESEYSVPESPSVSEWAAPEPEMEPGVAPTPEPTVPMPAFQPQIQAPAATTVLPAFVPAPKPAAVPAPPPAEAEAEDLSKRSVEVRPPVGFKKDKPGFGFDQVQAQPGMSVEEARKHDEARRFARLLVSEIKLYNEPKVDEGRKNKSIYSLLREDIDRSKQIYEERIAAEIRSKSDYFRQALVSILANGDAAAMGAMD